MNMKLLEVVRQLCISIILLMMCHAEDSFKIEQVDFVKREDGLVDVVVKGFIILDSGGFIVGRKDGDIVHLEDLGALSCEVQEKPEKVINADRANDWASRLIIHEFLGKVSLIEVPPAKKIQFSSKSVGSFDMRNPKLIKDLFDIQGLMHYRLLLYARDSRSKVKKLISNSIFIDILNIKSGFSAEPGGKVPPPSQNQ